MTDFKTLLTDDGSLTLLHPTLKDSYHSLQGAMLEALHVYIKAGFESIEQSDISILEMGFGTGLNALLTLDNALQRGINTSYCTVELYPVDIDVAESLYYETNIAAHFSYDTEHELLLRKAFLAMHHAPWGEKVEITPSFSITKIKGAIQEIELPHLYDLVYWDAFSFETQPDLWSSDIFSKIHNALSPAGLLTTYSAKGEVKRALREVGFTVKRAKGFGTKHHMLIAMR